MIIWLPFVFLLIVAAILVAMPWRKPHPNHVFLFELVESLPATPEREAAEFTVHSFSCNAPLTIGKYKFGRGGF